MERRWILASSVKMSHLSSSWMGKGLASLIWAHTCAGLCLMLTFPASFSAPSCDEQWGSLYCDEPETSLPTQLKDNFNRAPSNQNWLTVNGGKLSTVCGAVASGMALHFSGVSGWLLVSHFCILWDSPQWLHLLWGLIGRSRCRVMHSKCTAQIWTCNFIHIRMH